MGAGRLAVPSTAVGSAAADGWGAAPDWHGVAVAQVRGGVAAEVRRLLAAGASAGVVVCVACAAAWSMGGG